MRAVVTLLLLLEGLATGVRTLRVVLALEFLVYPPATLVLLGARAGVGLLQFGAGGLLLRRHRLGSRLGAASWLLSTGLVVLEQGFRLAPTNVFPDDRWLVVAVYGTYAAVAGWAALRC